MARTCANTPPGPQQDSKLRGRRANEAPRRKPTAAKKKRMEAEKPEKGRKNEGGEAEDEVDEEEDRDDEKEELDEVGEDDEKGGVALSSAGHKRKAKGPGQEGSDSEDDEAAFAPPPKKAPRWGQAINTYNLKEADALRSYDDSSEMLQDLDQADEIPNFWKAWLSTHV